jgi:hypothetical protein
MAVINPNYEDTLGGVAVSTWPAVAVEDRTDRFAFRSVSMGTGFAAAAGVTAAGTLVLSYPAGTAFVQGVSYPYSSGSVTVTTNSGLLDRRDAIVYRVGSGVTYLIGTPATYTPTGACWAPYPGSAGSPPVKPTVNPATSSFNSALVNESTDAIMCEVTMPYNATTVSTTFSATAGYVVDKSNVLITSPTSSFESAVRANGLDQLQPPKTPLYLGQQPIRDMLHGIEPSDGATMGQVVIASIYNSGAHTYSIASSTPAAIDTSNLTVSFIATQTSVLVELAATYVFNSTGSGSQVWLLFAHGGTTQVGMHQIVHSASTAAIDAIALPARAYILVTGLTLGTAYQYDWAWGATAGTANLNTGGATSGVVATTDYGTASMRVLLP